MMRVFLYIVSLNVWLGLLAETWAQGTDYAFRQLTITKGLSNNQVNCLTRDSRGFLWVGTLSGLNRYDGYSFRVFRHSPKDSTTLPNNYISRLFEDPAGRMWVTTRRGNAVYDPITDHFHRNVAPFLRAMGLPSTILHDIHKDRRGNYWLMTTSGLYHYQSATKRTEPVHHRPGDATTPADDSLTSLHEDHQGGIWIAHRSGLLERLDGQTQRITHRSDVLYRENGGHQHIYRLFIDADDELWLRMSDEPNGVFRINPYTGQLTHFQHGSKANSLNNNFVHDITQDEQGLIWIGTDHGGINLFDKKNNTIRYLLHHPFDQTSVGQNSIYDFYRDSDGIIWVGTYKQGISYYHKNGLQFPLYQHRASDPGSLSHNDVNCFVEDQQSNLWIGTNGGGLVYFDRANRRFTPSTTFAKAAGANSIVVSLLIDHEQTLWVGTYMGGLYAIRGNQVTIYKHDATTPTSVISNNIWELFEDRRKNLWIGTLDGGLDRFDRRRHRFDHHRPGNGQFIKSNYISSILEDRDGKLWVGTANGINVLDTRSGKTRHYANYTNDPKGLSNNTITTLLEDSRGKIWVGTGEGLNRFDKATETFRTLRQEDGLPDNTIQTLVEDANHALWIGTPNGLSQMTIRRDTKGQETYLFRNYDESDGLPGRAFNENAVYKTRRGELLFGGASGFTLFRPETFRPASNRYLVVLTDFQVFNQSVRPGQEVAGTVPLPEAIDYSQAITLTHRQNIFSLEFAALNFLHPEKTRYQYKLDGFNDHWLTADSRVRKATFTNLNPGEYIFRVRVADNDSGWKESSVRLNIRVLPPFWRSPIAYAFYVLLVVGLLLLARWILLERARLTFQIEQDRQYARQMREVDEMKTRFFTNVSHEFRTPLTLILSPLQQLLRDDGDTSQQRQLQLIYRNAKRLLNLVNQLLDFRKMEVQGLTLRLTRQDVVAFSREIFNSFSDLSERKHIHFTFDSNVAELEAVFDQDKVERILFNLLSNAFKFTPAEGHVALTLDYPVVRHTVVRHTGVQTDIQSATDAEHWLTIQVTDTGIGIAPEQQEKIFERFFQSDLPGMLINQGSGIGLAITKEFVQLHGGTLSVTSELNQGSTFTVRLPIRTTADFETSQQPVQEIVELTQALHPTSTDTDQPAKTRAKKPVVLLVEDNEDFRFYLKDNLSRQYTLLEAANGKEGWALVQAHHPDLVVSDVMMPVQAGPEMDGISLCRRIKADRHTAHIPVLLLTARSAEEQRLEGFETGASDYITKPFNVQILHARINNLIAQQNLLQKAIRPTVDIQPGEIAITSLDDKLIQKALAIVEKNIGNPDFSVEELSQEMNMSRVHLYKKLLALTDKSPIEFIRIIRLRRAAQLLSKSQLTVAEIAYEVGFNSPKNFAKYFKQEFGVIPSQYAAQHQKDPRINISDPIF